MSAAAGHAREPVLELARALIARPSLTPDDAGCQKLIAERLLAHGFEAEWFYCNEVSNVLLTRGVGSPSLWFLGHTDVVPPGPESDWDSPPFEPDEREGFLYGRGAADMKGAVAAMVVALERFVAQLPEHPGQLGLLLTSDEEGVAIDGVTRVADVIRERGTQPDFCLVGEPSSVEQLGDTVRVGRRGSINGVLTVFGVQGHTAFPHTIDNPVYRLAPFLTELAATRWDDGDEQFPPTHCQVSNIQAGTGAENVTPGSARLMFNFRNGPASSPEMLESRVRDMLARHGIERLELEWRVNGKPFRSRPGLLRDAVLGSVRQVLDRQPELNTGGGTSDGRFIAPLGTEVLELGLINASIHKVNENTNIEHLAQLGAAYQAVLERIFNT
jgi:succinyl-diaminopimelate desuccinylase